MRKSGFGFNIFFCPAYPFNSSIKIYLCLPLPLLPTNLRSLNLAIWFFITAVQFLSSAQQFSSLPALTVTTVPSNTSPKATTLKAIGNVLFDRQCVGNKEHKKYGLPVRTSSPGCSAWISWRILSVHQRSPFPEELSPPVCSAIFRRRLPVAIDVAGAGRCIEESKIFVYETTVFTQNFFFFFYNLYFIFQIIKKVSLKYFFFSPKRSTLYCRERTVLKKFSRRLRKNW